MPKALKPPFPWFGGKSKVAEILWTRFGNVPNYIEPFFGSGATFLKRPSLNQNFSGEIVNDFDWYVANFWRSLIKAPEEVATWASWPINEADLHARHDWLHAQAEFRTNMRADLDYYNPKVAGWWVWGLCQWIGSGWCALDRSYPTKISIPPHGGESGTINRLRQQRPHLGSGMGLNRLSQQRPHLSDHGNGILRPALRNQNPVALENYLKTLSKRLQNTKVYCGDWKEVLPPLGTLTGPVGIMLDPPYSKEANRDNDLYSCENMTVAHEVRKWCLENGTNLDYRIALCGYEGEHEELEQLGWDVLAWKTGGGYAINANCPGKNNIDRERIWFSPGCLPPQGITYSLADLAELEDFEENVSEG